VYRSFIETLYKMRSNPLIILITLIPVPPPVPPHSVHLSH
jgi:hypothetical protein